MATRRSLSDGLEPILLADEEKERAFVFGNNAKEPQTKDTSAAPAQIAPSGVSQSRTPVSTKLRQDLAAALKRASLERQLSGSEPNTVQDILEEALEPWLRTNGYLK